MCAHTDEKAPHICASLVPIFQSLELAELQQINALIIKREYPKGTTLFNKGDKAESLCIVRLGRVKVYDLSADGRQQTIRILKPGDFFGEFALFNESFRLFYAEAMQNTGLCLLEKEKFKELLARNATISYSVIQALVSRLADAEQNVGNLALRNVDQRLARLLYDLAVSNGEKQPKGIRINLGISRGEIANIVGTSRETISRVLTVMQEDGLIVVDGHKGIIVKDIDRLLALTNE
ncbi:MAG: transcriptional regulator, Crp/Fnr family [Anaerosporomusa subterranea]|jgi:CRP/FNR family transcriptional regulator|nr:transcriptional regulator, Crp/Fnr family [Anaerosporomusa subterranea]